MLRIYSFLAVIILLVNCTGSEISTTTPVTVTPLPLPTNTVLPKVTRYAGFNRDILSQPTDNLEDITPTVIPAITPVENSYTIGQEVFSNAHSSNILPDGLLNEVDYFGGGGGPGELCINTNYSSPKVEKINVFWPYGMSFLTCGWDFDANKTVEIRITDQDGKEVVYSYQMHEVNTYGDSTVEFGHSLKLNDIFNVYQVEVRVATETLQFTVNVQGQRPFIYQLHDKNGDLTHLILVYFKPNEQVDVLFYKQNATDFLYYFQRKNNYKTDSKGNLIIELHKAKSENEVYFAIGDVSGEAYPIHAKYTDSIFEAGIVDLGANYDDPIHILESKEIQCKDVLPTQLRLDSKAKVIADHLNVRERPSIHGETVKHTSLSQNRIITILDGPHCSNGYIWWKGDSGEITLSDGSTGRLIGWMVEADDKERYLEPVEP